VGSGLLWVGRAGNSMLQTVVIVRVERLRFAWTGR
jgi:hypothetical protein